MKLPLERNRSPGGATKLPGDFSVNGYGSDSLEFGHHTELTVEKRKQYRYNDSDTDDRILRDFE